MKSNTENASATQKCRYCDMELKNKKSHHHCLMSLTKSSTDLLKCELCKEEFYEEEVLNGHLMFRHCVLPSYYCFSCPENFVLIKDLMAHVKQAHCKKIEAEKPVAETRTVKRAKREPPKMVNKSVTPVIKQLNSGEIDFEDMITSLPIRGNK